MTSWNDDVQKELLWGREALSIGNHGKARTCARRAVGKASAELCRHDSTLDYGADMMSRIRGIAGDERFPETVRAAAERLQSRISADFTSLSVDPIRDAEIVLSDIAQRIGSAQARSSDR